MILFKLFKRGIFDFPFDIFRWLSFYFNRNRLPNELAEIESLGFQKLHNVVLEQDLLTLNHVGRELLSKADVDQRGQLNGRVYSQGLIDFRLTNIVEKFKKVAVQYLGSRKVCLELTYFQVSKAEKEIDDIPGGSYHMDDNKPNLKFFVYLCDVGTENGPLKFIPRSHGLKLGKLKRYVLWSFLKRRKDLYTEPSLMRKIENAATKIVGPRGLSVAVDTTGWHSAEPVINGERYVFVASFNYG